MNEHQREWLGHYRALARSHGGACLSSEYRNAHGVLRWRCAEGHEWDAKADVVKSGYWCRTCAIEAHFSQIQAIAREKGGLCLSTKFANLHTPLRWRCAEGHEWEIPANAVKRGRWCRVCSNEARHGGSRARAFSEVKAIAREKGGLCLSTKYVNNRAPLRFRCAEGHEWETAADAVRAGKWCAPCSFEARYGDMGAQVFARVQAIARESGGLCLSTEYVNSYTHLHFRCAEGHEWHAAPAGISRGSWCPFCAGKVLTIDDMREIARTRGGRCLSRSYRNSRSPLRWRCDQGHEWTSCLTNIRRGTWCPRCVGVAPKTLADVQELAAGHGGICLSTSIEPGADRLRFRCRVGHEFESLASRVQQGNWCPRCRGVPRGTLERLRQAVQGRGGVLLETEYHNSKVPVRVRCREGHEWSTVPSSLISGRWCRECGILAAKGRSNQKLSIDDMHEVAASRGGRCLSDTYVNAVTHLRWQCHDGHEWDATPSGVRAGHWCLICAHRHPGTIDAMRALAAERGGTCRSRAYRGHADRLRFTCARGHEFIATGMAVKSGAWCPTCGEWDAPIPERPRRRGPTRS